MCVTQPSGVPGAAPELGHVACGGLQLNCHGFTEMLCGERVEYAWLMQLQLHRISAALTTLQVRGQPLHALCSACTIPLSPSQLAEVAGWLQATVQQVVGVADTTVEAPNGKPIRPQVEPLSEDIKYSLFDLAVGEADVHLLEGDSVLRLQVRQPPYLCACRQFSMAPSLYCTEPRAGHEHVQAARRERDTRPLCAAACPHLLCIHSVAW